jgi:hypothetical protein
MVDKNEALRTAIDVMTAWTDQQDSTEFISRRAGEHLAGTDEGVELTSGLVTLCGVLLLNLAKAAGASGDGTPEEQRAILQDLARGPGADDRDAALIDRHLRSAPGRDPRWAHFGHTWAQTKAIPANYI